jgi:hypothetical protein
MDRSIPIRTIITFAAVVLAALAGAPAATARARPVAVELRLVGGQCDHKVDETRLKMSRSKDIVVVDVSNYGVADDNGLVSAPCGREQAVVLCAYAGTALSRDVFETCTSLPSGLDINTVFKVAAWNSSADTKRLMCAVKQNSPQRSVLLVISGEVGAVTCPDPKPLVDHHTIQIEIVP